MTVFVSTLEADSVCALRILQVTVVHSLLPSQPQQLWTRTNSRCLMQAVLETSGQHYSVIPVASYEEIRQAFDQQLNQDEELKNVVLINCGGTIDLLGLLEPQSGTRLIVVDSHRPIHHNLINSLDDHAVVICEDDDLHPQTELPAADGASEDEQEDEEEARPTSRCESSAHSQLSTNQTRAEIQWICHSRPTEHLQRFNGFATLDQPNTCRDSMDLMGPCRRRSDSGSVDGLSRGGEARRQRRKRLRQCRKDYYSLGAFGAALPL